MKKIFLLMTMMVMTIVSVKASELSSDQLQLRSDIMSFLRTEGYAPELDSDGDISFKKEGEKYFISVSSTDTDPYYVTINKGYSLSDATDALKCAYIGNEIANLKTAKLQVYSKSCIISIEMYLTSVSHFKATFKKHMHILSNAASKFETMIREMEDL